MTAAEARDLVAAEEAKDNSSEVLKLVEAACLGRRCYCYVKGKLVTATTVTRLMELGYSFQQLGMQPEIGVSGDYYRIQW